VLLRYFGVSNPVNMFELDPIAHAHWLQQITEAVATNRESRMFRAAQSAYTWLSKPWSNKRQDKIIKALHKTLDWPSGSLRDLRPLSNEAQQWRAQYEGNLAFLGAKAQSIQTDRQARIRLLSRAATPGANGRGTHLLLDIATEALPRLDTESSIPAEAPAA
jgi:hypothetical protein